MVARQSGPKCFVYNKESSWWTLGLDSDFGGKDSIGLVTEDAGLECLLHQRQVSLGSATYNLTDYNV